MTNSYGILAANLTAVSLFHREFHPVRPRHGKKAGCLVIRVYKFALEKSGRVYLNVLEMSHICFRESHVRYLYRIFYYESDFKYLYIFLARRQFENRKVCSNRIIALNATKDAASSSSMYNSLRRFKVPKSISPDDKGEVARD